jgi:cytochrome b561
MPVQRAHYTATAQWLHWITALLMLATIPIIWQAHVMQHGVPIRAVLFAAHKSIGVTILLLTVARLTWRARHPAPPFAPAPPRWSVLLARTNHVLLYVVLLGMPITGYIHSATGGHPVNYFGLFDLPLLPTDEALSQATLAIHLAMQWLVYALVVLHVLGTVWHVAVRRDGTLGRMLPPQREAP